jgi:hypothetical protein
MTDKTQMAIAQLRFFRDEKLRSTDTPWGISDFEHQDKAAWLAYRQALRNLPNNSQPTLDENDVLQNVIWPVAPNEMA